MTIYHSREAVENLGYTIYKYADGNNPDIGDEIICVRDNSGIRVGDKGRVVCFVDYYIGVDFGPRVQSIGRDFDGVLEQTTGLTVNQGHYNLVSRAPELTEEEQIQKLSESVLAAPKSLVLDGKFYTLSLTPDVTAENYHKILLASISERIRMIRRTANEKIEAVKRKYANIAIMPNIGLTELLTHRVQLFSTNGYVGYFVPMTYEPKYIIKRTRGEAVPTLEISSEHQAILKREIYVYLLVKNNHIQTVGSYELVDNTPKPFFHYHGNGDNCIGTLDVHSKEITGLADILEVRDALQKLFQTINGMSLVSDMPRNLPSFNELVNQATKLKGSVGWNSTDLELKVGDLVKVIKSADEFPREDYGAIGKIVVVYSPESFCYDAGYRYGVEFLFEFANGHNCDGNTKKGHGYNFKADEIEKAPAGSARTRLSKVASPVVRPSRLARPTAPFSTVDEPEAEPMPIELHSLENAPHNIEDGKFPDGEAGNCTRCGASWSVHYDWLCRDQYYAWRRHGQVIENSDPYEEVDLALIEEVL